MSDHPFIPYAAHDPGAPALDAARAFADRSASRRSVRMFSDRPVDAAVITELIRAAGTAPSGANKQPWRFVAVNDPELKRRIRVAAEEEERAFYDHRAPAQWLADLAPFETNPDKPFLEVAPWLVVVFRLTQADDGGQVYYGQESVGIACGLLLAAIHHAGLVALTHTPSPMGFLREVCGRPEHERPFLLIPVGYPADDCRVPDIQRKPLDEIAVFRTP